MFSEKFLVDIETQEKKGFVDLRNQLAICESQLREMERKMVECETERDRLSSSLVGERRTTEEFDTVIKRIENPTRYGYSKLIKVFTYQIPFCRNNSWYLTETGYVFFLRFGYDALQNGRIREEFVTFTKDVSERETAKPVVPFPFWPMDVVQAANTFDLPRLANGVIREFVKSLTPTIYAISEREANEYLAKL